MSQQERRRLELLARVRDEELTLVEVAEWLPLSDRQTKRLWRRDQDKGDAGWVHRWRGQPSSRRSADATRRSILALDHAHDAGFGPTLAAEKLAQRDDHHLDHETLRRGLLADGSWQRQRKRGRHRQRRERQPHRGQLVQIDGSEHDWFEGRGPRAVLMVLIDDATNHTVARCYEAEDPRAACDVFGRDCDQYGLPQALDADLDSIDRVKTPEAAQASAPPLTQFGRALKQWDVRIVPAYSPQAQGRVERRHGVFQERLVNELRLAKIQSLAEANRYLEETFLPDLNARFTVAPAQSVDVHRKLPRGARLEEVLCGEQERVVARDWTLSWEKRAYQLEQRPAALSLVGRRVVVREWWDGRRQLLSRGQQLHWREVAVSGAASAPAARAPLAVGGGAPKPSARAARPRSVPAATHPWRRWGIAAGAATRRAGPSAPATDRVSLKEGSPPDVGGGDGSQRERLAITTMHKKPGRNAVNVGGCGGRGRRRGAKQGTFLSS